LTFNPEWGVNSRPTTILAINGGSSSIRFSVFDEASMTRQLLGKIDRIRLKSTSMSVLDSSGKAPVYIAIPSLEHERTVDFLLDWLAEHPGFPSTRAVGHQVVHGMKHTAPTLITPAIRINLRCNSRKIR
jgi:acetate kinase